MSLLEMDKGFLSRSLNEGFYGGEKSEMIFRWLGAQVGHIDETDQVWILMPCV